MHNKRIFDSGQENFDLFFLHKANRPIANTDTRYQTSRKILSLNNIKMPIFMVLLPIMQKPPLALRASFRVENGKRSFRCRTRYPSVCILGQGVLCKTLTFRHRASSIQDRRFAVLQRTLYIYIYIYKINKYISLSDICLTVHH